MFPTAHLGSYTEHKNFSTIVFETAYTDAMFFHSSAGLPKTSNGMSTVFAHTIMKEYPNVEAKPNGNTFKVPCL